MSKYIDMTDQRFGSLVAKKFLGGTYGEWLCECDCGNKAYITRGKYLRIGYKTHCDKCNTVEKSNEFEDLTGRKFGEWTVLKYLGKSTWLCSCSCGRTLKNIKSTQLKTKQATMCDKCREEQKSNNIRYDLTGEKIGSIEVIKYIKGGSWECRCKCGNILTVKGYNLRKAKENNSNYMCEKCVADAKREDLTGMTFGLWHVDKYLGNGNYQCTCGCNNRTVRSVSGKSLKHGTSTSCGCAMREKSLETKLSRYGDITVNTKERHRTKEQIEASAYSDKLENFIQNKFDEKPTLYQLAENLGITPAAVGRKIHKFKLEHLINYESNISSIELQVRDIISKLYSGNIEYNVRDIIAGELDIYIPELKVAIEVNGSYWHSSVYKTKKYHQNKTISCAKLGIRLIHIFDYEWNNDNTREKIINILKNIFNCTSEAVYARDCDIEYIDVNKTRSFLEQYHIQGYTSSSINIALSYQDEILGVMTFGKPRYDYDNDYEIIRLAYKNGIRIIGGTERMFKHIVADYNIKSVITYVDIAKFTGKSYSKLGFKSDKSMITSPNYVWVNIRSNEVLPRYQTMKHLLVKQGLGEADKTEDEIMESMGFFKVYNSGNLKMVWKRESI